MGVAVWCFLSSTDRRTTQTGQIRMGVQGLFFTFPIRFFWPLTCTRATSKLLARTDRRTANVLFWDTSRVESSRLQSSRPLFVSRQMLSAECRVPLANWPTGAHFPFFFSAVSRSPSSVIIFISRLPLPFAQTGLVPALLSPPSAYPSG